MRPENITLQACKDVQLLLPLLLPLLLLPLLLLLQPGKVMRVVAGRHEGLMARVKEVMERSEGAEAGKQYLEHVQALLTSSVLHCLTLETEVGTLACRLGW
jgi:hypothetical protein